MCGIVGIYTGAPTSAELLEPVADRMARALEHRGPDDHGTWADPDAGIAFGHRRLSIIDLSPAGHQPMHSASERYTVSYNGEIYNFRELRAQLEATGRRFRGTSDTEVLLEAVSEWGVQDAIGRLNGMFAIAIWDHRERSLSLGRDRFGEKPLFYGWFGSSLLFGSELKAFRVHPEYTSAIDPASLGAFLRFGYVPAPASIHPRIAKVQPGTIVTFTPSEGRVPRVSTYWSVASAMEAARDRPFRGSFEDAVEQLDGLLRDAVRSRMVSDVPLGAFLSGGVDSSTVVSLMGDAGGAPPLTFSIGFTDPRFDEAPFAAAVAAHLGTRHHTLVATPEEAMAVIPELHRIYDEPFADSSQIPTVLVSRLARQSVTVSLSGDGGDELFAGYNHYRMATDAWRRLRPIPRTARRAVAAGLHHAPDAAMDLVGRVVAGAGRGRLGDGAAVVRRGRRLASLLPAGSFGELYEQVGCLSPDWSSLVDQRVLAAMGGGEPMRRYDWMSDWQHMSYVDASSYLPDDILVKVDRASMAVALESRIPLLDPHVAEFAWSVPHEMLVSGGKGKQLLRAVLRRYVPDTLIDRPKKGFSVPVVDWLRGPMRPWAEALLEPGRLGETGLLDARAIRTRWDGVVAGRTDRAEDLWAVLMFEAWRRDGG